MPRRVLIDGTKLLDLRTDGIKRYVHELVVALDAADTRPLLIDVALSSNCIVPLHRLAERLNDGDLLAKFVPRLLSAGAANPLLACKARLASGAPNLLAQARDQVELQAWRIARSSLRRWLRLKSRLYPRRECYDLVHLTLPNTWRHYAASLVRLLTTVHDLSNFTCPDFQTTSNNLSLSEGLAFARRARSRYVAVSNATATELTTRLGISPDKIDVVHEGVDHTHFATNPTAKNCQRVRARYGLPSGRFLFCLGTIEPRKNLLNTVRGFRLLRQQHPEWEVSLVIAGEQGWGEHRELERLVDGCQCIDSIGYVHEEDLPVLYGMCEAFCYVSHYEGFGLPLLEAMSCGAPVIYGNNSSLPEVAGAGGLGVAVNDTHAIANAMQRILSDTSLRTVLAKNASLQATRFNWNHTAAATLKAYDQCLSTMPIRSGVIEESACVKVA